jgi:hypothetical protein
MSKLELPFYILFLYVPVYAVKPVLEAPHLGSQPKQALYKKILYIPQLTEERMDMRGGSIFISDVLPTNIFLYSSVPRNIKNYIHRRYIPR